MTSRKQDLYNKIITCLSSDMKMKVIVSSLAEEFDLSQHTIYKYIRDYMRGNGFRNREQFYVAQLRALRREVRHLQVELNRGA